MDEQLGKPRGLTEKQTFEENLKEVKEQIMLKISEERVFQAKKIGQSPLRH